MKDQNNIYFILTSKNSKSNAYLAISDEVPRLNEQYNCKRLIYYYGGCYEDAITTSKIRKIKKINDDVYKIRTNHVYYVKVTGDS